MSGSGRERWLLVAEVCLLLSLQALSTHSFLLGFASQLSTSSRLHQTPIGPSTETATKKGGRRANVRVREILEILQNRAGTRNDTPDGNNKLGPEWAKTRRYLYHREDLTADHVEKVVQFLQEVLQEDRVLVASVIQAHPRILRKSVERYLEPTALFLEKLYGEDLFLEAVRRNPGLLLTKGVGCDAAEDSIVSIEELCQSLGLKGSDLKSLREKDPGLFSLNLQHVKSVVAYWDDILRHTGKPKDARRIIIGKLLKSYPTIFNLSVEKGLVPKVSFLETSCGLSKVDVASLLTGRRAALFCLSVEDNLRHSVELLTEILCARTNREGALKHLRKCIVSHPHILCLSRSNLQSKVEYFNEIDRVCAATKGDSLAARVALCAPQVYSLSFHDNIIPKVEFLASVWGTEAPTIVQGRAQVSQSMIVQDNMKERSGPNLSTLLGENPSILTLSLEGNIQPTLNFYNRTGFICLDDNWKLQGVGNHDDDVAFSTNKTGTIVRGRYIASSLFQRLLPRWHFYLMNKERYAALFDELKTPNLHLLAAASDEAFCAYLKVYAKDFKSFKEEAAPRLKFSSQFDTWLKTGRPIE